MAKKVEARKGVDFDRQLQELVANLTALYKSMNRKVTGVFVRSGEIIIEFIQIGEQRITI
jgi:hypothetical protein